MKIFKLIALFFLLYTVSLADTGGAKDHSVSLLSKGRYVSIVKDSNSFIVSQNYNSTHGRKVNFYDNNFDLIKSISSPTPNPGDDFGYSISVDRSLMAIGAPGDYNGMGSVYIYEKKLNNWEFRNKINYPGNSSDISTSFGKHVIIKNNFLIISAPDEHNGKVYIYKFDNNNNLFKLFNTLHPTDNHNNHSNRSSLLDPEAKINYSFGIDFDIDINDNILIGSANNSVFYFNLNDISDDFMLENYEIPYHHSHTYEYNHFFGYSVKIGEKYLYIGSLGCDDGSGKVRLIEKDNFNQFVDVSPSEKISNTHFGFNFEENDNFLFISSFNNSNIYTLEKNDDGDFLFDSLIELNLNIQNNLSARNIILGENDNIYIDDYYNDRIVEFSIDNLSFKNSYQINSSSTKSLGYNECVNGLAASIFPCKNITLLSFLNKTEIGGSSSTSMNDIWGWTDPDTSIEYALIGMSNGTAFVNLNDPQNPIYVGILPTQTFNSSWRDIKVYEDYAFIVSEASSHGMQIFDLKELRNFSGVPITFSSKVYSGFGNAHNIFINESTGFAYAVGTSDCGPGGLNVIDIRSPDNPANAGCFSDPSTGRLRNVDGVVRQTGYVHDVQCVIYEGPDTIYNGKEICFGSNETDLWIVDVSNKTNDLTGANTISIGSYDSSYTHQGWLTEDQRFFIQNDELDEYYNETSRTKTIIWNVEDLDNPFIHLTYLGPYRSIDHNNYVLGNNLYMSHYTSGLRVLDISNVNIPNEIAYFDVYPANNSNKFEGSWSNYPYFESGTIVATGIGEGLFVLKLDEEVYGAPTSDFYLSNLQVFDNSNNFNEITYLDVDLSNYLDSLKISWTESVDPEGVNVAYKLQGSGKLSFMSDSSFKYNQQNNRMFSIKDLVASTDSTNVYNGQLQVLATDGYNIVTSNSLIFTLDPSGIIPEESFISQNFPNPFNDSTTINFELPESGYVSIRIFNSRGQLIRELVKENQLKGYKSVSWDGKNSSGDAVSSGVYFYQINAPDLGGKHSKNRFIKAKKMLKLR